MKNSNDNIGNRTRDLPACSAVPQPTAPPRARLKLRAQITLHHKPTPFPVPLGTEYDTATDSKATTEIQTQSFQTQQLLPTGKMTKRITKWF